MNRAALNDLAAERELIGAAALNRQALDLLRRLHPPEPELFYHPGHARLARALCALDHLENRLEILDREPFVRLRVVGIEEAIRRTGGEAGDLALLEDILEEGAVIARAEMAAATVRRLAAARWLSSTAHQADTALGGWPAVKWDTIGDLYAAAHHLLELAPAP